MKPIDYIVIGMTTFLAFALWAKSSDHTVENVQSGKWTLECHMSDGIRDINGSKLISREDNNWIFTNGSASNCRVIK